MKIGLVYFSPLWSAPLHETGDRLQTLTRRFGVQNISRSAWLLAIGYHNHKYWEHENKVFEIGWGGDYKPQVFIPFLWTKTVPT